MSQFFFKILTISLDNKNSELVTNESKNKCKRDDNTYVLIVRIGDEISVRDEYGYDGKMNKNL